MLRLAVLLLILANTVYFAWSQGLLLAWGVGPLQQSEPHRLEQQVRPEAVRVLPADEAKRLEPAPLAASGASGAAGAKPAECVQAGVFAEAEIDPLKQALAGWPEGSWALEPGVEPARWIVYMGKYPDAANVARKRAELRGLGVSFEPLLNTALEPGLSLGGYPTEGAARQQLDVLAAKGVRTAKVVQERQETRGQLLRLPSVDDALRPRLDELRTVLAGKALRPCR